MRLAFLLISMALMACSDNRHEPVIAEVAAVAESLATAVNAGFKLPEDAGLISLAASLVA